MTRSGYLLLAPLEASMTTPTMPPSRMLPNVAPVKLEASTSFDGS
jgi:hypothetical protein